jgi:hypothetical protein
MLSGSRYANDRVLARSSYVIDTMSLAAAVLVAVMHDPRGAFAVQSTIVAIGMG